MNKKDLIAFLPSKADIISILDDDKSIKIWLKSGTSMQLCPKCHTACSHKHSTYLRKIKDISYWGKSVELTISAYKYDCNNEECDQRVFCEELDGFTGKYKRMTDRLEALIVAIACNTNCEVASKVCKQMNIDVSGDTVIRTILRNIIIKSVGDTLRSSDIYYSSICDKKTGKILARLVKTNVNDITQWLMENKKSNANSKYIVSSYVKTLSKILPLPIESADRIKLYKSTFKAVRGAVQG